MSIKHKKTVFAEDGTDPNTVHPSDWNDAHVIDGLLGLFAALAVRPNAFPYVAADGTGALASISAPALAMLSKATAAAILESIGGVGPASPAFSGAPTAPTAGLGTNTDQIATMAALQAMRADLVSSAPSTLDTLNELANALGADPNFAATVTAALGNRLRVDAAQACRGARSGERTFEHIALRDEIEQERRVSDAVAADRRRTRVHAVVAHVRLRDLHHCGTVRGTADLEADLDAFLFVAGRAEPVAFR